MKMILTADVHIHDYPQFNTDGFRLNQYIRFARRLVKIGQSEESTTLVIAGDLADEARHTPKVSHAISEFISILKTHYTNILFILGQHDISSKEDGGHYENSIVPLLAVGCDYVDGQILTIGGRQIAFSDWRATQDWSFIKSKVDVMIGHLTMSNRFGQEYDDSLYTIGFFGDIHQRNSIRNSHTINIPVPHNISDCQDGSVVSLNLDDLSWERINVETEDDKYLKFFYEDTLPKELEDHPYLYVKQRPQINAVTNTIYKSIDVNEVITKLVSLEDLQECHDWVSPRVVADSETLDFNFQLVSINIQNFRSISSLDYQFSPGLIYVHGLNGSGKSSMLRALNYCLTGSESPRECVSDGQQSLSVSVTLNYSGREFIITRKWSGSQTFTVTIDGEPINGGSIRDREAELYRQLPFLSYFEVLYRSQKSPPLLNQYGFAARIEIIKSLLGLNSITSYFDAAQLQLKSINKDVAQITSDLGKQQEVVASLVDTNFEGIDGLPQLIETRNELDYERTKLTSYMSKINAVESCQSAVNMYLDDLGGIEEVPNDAEIKSKILSVKSRKIALEATVSEIRSVINNHKSSTSRAEQLMIEIGGKIDKLTKDIDKVQTHCSHCKQPLTEESIEEVRKSIKVQIGELENEGAKAFDVYSAKCPSSQEDIDKLLSEIEPISTELTDLQVKLREIESTRDKIRKLDTAKSNLESAKRDLGEDVLPFDVPTRLTELNDELTKLDSEVGRLTGLKSVHDKLVAAEAQVDELSKELADLSVFQTKMSKYTSMFSPSGSVTASVFKEVAARMTTPDMRITTVREQVNGDRKIDFDVEYKVNKLMIPYQQLSGGQSALVDILFLSRLIMMSRGAGVLILDESLKEIDESMIKVAVDEIKQLPVTNVILVTHVPSFQDFDYKIGVTMVDNVSQYNIQ